MIYLILACTALISIFLWIIYRSILKESNFIEILENLQDELNGIHSQIEALEDLSHPKKVETNSDINI